MKYSTILSPTLLSIAVAAICSSAISAQAATEAGVVFRATRAQQSAGPATDRIIVKLRSMQPGFMIREIKADTMHNLSAAAGVTLTMHHQMSGGAHVLSLPKKMSAAEAETYVSDLRAHPDVIYAEVNHVRRAELVPNDPYYTGLQVNLVGGSTLFADQWYLKNQVGGINAPAAWDITTGSANVRIAVLDTGIAPHSDMTGRTIAGYDFITNIPSANDGGARDADASDPGDWVTAADITNPIFSSCALTSTDIKDSSWHGTTVAAIVGASANNTVGIAGVNWNSKLLPLRVLGKCGGDDSDIANAIRYAAGVVDPAIPTNLTPARVINLSLGGPTNFGCGSVYPAAIADATAKNAVIVASAGNGSIDVSGHAPGGSCAGIITVAGTGKFGERASYSNYGTAVTISAPGGNKYDPNNWDGTMWVISNKGTTAPDPAPAGDGYAAGEGTSYSAPVVSGVISLMLSVNPNLTTAQVISILKTKYKPFPALTTAQITSGMIQCTTVTCGVGIVDAAAAVAEAKRLAPATTPTPTPTPTPAPTPTATPTPAPGAISSGGGGCTTGPLQGPADMSLPLLLSMGLLWRARRKAAIK